VLLEKPPLAAGGGAVCGWGNVRARGGGVTSFFGVGACGGRGGGGGVGGGLATTME